MARKRVSHYRSTQTFGPTSGMSALQVALDSFENLNDVNDGEIVLSRYDEGAGGVRTVAGIYCNNNTNTGWTFLIDSREFARKPVTLWETDGTTGLLGNNDGTPGENWQLTGLDMTPYKYIKCYFKISDFKTSSNYLTPALVVTIPLDAASRAQKDNTAISPSVPCDMYIGGVNSTNPSDRNVSFCILAAVDTTKTKFQVISQHSIYGTALGGRNDNGRYCYKIEGYFD